METLDEVMDHAMQLPLEARLCLIEVVRRRTFEEIREQMAADAVEARRAFRAGELPIGTVDDFLKAAEQASL